MYLTRQIHIKKGHPLYQYFKTYCLLSNNLYNTVCFYLRQYASSRKSLEEYKPFKFSRLVMDGSVMDYLLEFENHLKGYADLIELELKEKYPAPSEKDSFIEQVKYLNMIQEMVDEFVKEEVKLV